MQAGLLADASKTSPLTTLWQLLSHRLFRRVSSRRQAGQGLGVSPSVQLAGISVKHQSSADFDVRELRGDPLAVIRHHATGFGLFFQKRGHPTSLGYARSEPSLLEHLALLQGFVGGLAQRSD